MRIGGIELPKSMDRDYILNHVEYKVINKERNRSQINPFVHKTFLDLAVLYRIVVGFNGGGELATTLKNDLFEKLDISFWELDDAAARNTERVGYEIRTLTEIIGEAASDTWTLNNLLPSDKEQYILTNTKKINGANSLLFNHVFREFANKVEDDLYILPSSIHEVLIVQARGYSSDLLELATMVRDVNNAEVADDEILSYSVYKYSRDTDTLDIAVRGEGA